MFSPQFGAKKKVQQGIEPAAMTNTRQLTGAVALLASIAVLDNFIFVESEPGFESMALIKPNGSPGMAEVAQTSDSLRAQNEVPDFWIDQHKVSSADFAKFLEATGYEQQEIAPHSLQAFINQNGGFAVIVDDDNFRTQVENADWTKTSNSLPMDHTLTGQGDLKVNFNDAQTYCNWLGKVLPTAEQFEYIAKEDHDKKVSGLIEFRCVRNI